ncbi:hypothetical protein Nepgr_033297 [Nepenthes gracilis]|uniref:Uncharacterized protein n=1 Tax=Nepenthes gracilis TaxID=150966 RepID=A0AAD3Y8J9_NEPGR|nr:hypothetical protein Nepgr_033297 [Nepenthes gracilis]
MDIASPRRASTRRKRRSLARRWVKLKSQGDSPKEEDSDPGQANFCRRRRRLFRGCWRGYCREACGRSGNRCLRQGSSATSPILGEGDWATTLLPSPRPVGCLPSWLRLEWHLSLSRFTPSYASYKGSHRSSKDSERRLYS